MSLKIKTAVNNYFHTDGGILGAKEYFNYGISGFGQNLIYGLVSGYLMFFYTEVFLIPATTVGTMFLVARIWDAINDPIMGTFVDKTRTKWGKMRPYLLATPIPVAIMTILLFVAPDLSPTLKIVYMYVTYIAWGMIYTICDVPYWSLSAVLTPHAEERTNMVSFVRLLTGAGMGVPMIFVSLLTMLQQKGTATSLIGDNKKMYFLIGVIMAILGALLLSRGFFGTKEVVKQREKPPTFKENIMCLLKNKPVLMLLLSNILQFPRMIQVGAAMYVATYVFGGGQWVLILSIPATISGFLSFVLVPKLVKKFGAMNAFILSNVFWIIPNGLMFIVRPENVKSPAGLVLVFSMLFFSGFVGGIIGILPTLLIADCVDYSEWKTGQRNEGIFFSTQTFMAKVQAALQNYGIGIGLAIFAFVQPITGAGGEIVQQTQNASTLEGIWAMYSIIPSVGYILCVIPLFFYDLKGKKLKQVQDDLAIKRAKEYS